MGNAGSLPNASEEPLSDDSSLAPLSPAGLLSEDTSTRSFTTLSSEEDEQDYYHDVVEDTILCSSLFTRKNDALLLHTTTCPPPPTTTMKRSASSLSCYPSSSECTPPSMPRASSWTSMDEFGYTLEELNMHDGDLPTVQSDLRPSHERGCRYFWVVTTAALPWMTGTAVNPLLRAAHLSRLNREYAGGKSTVTLVVPWLESPKERVQMYGSEWENKTQANQDDYIRTWLAERAELPLEADLEQGGIQIQYVCLWSTYQQVRLSLTPCLSLLPYPSL